MNFTTLTFKYIRYGMDDGKEIPLSIHFNDILWVWRTEQRFNTNSYTSHYLQLRSIDIPSLHSPSTFTNALGKYFLIPKAEYERLRPILPHPCLIHKGERVNPTNIFPTNISNVMTDIFM